MSSESGHDLTNLEWHILNVCPLQAGKQLLPPNKCFLVNDEYPDLPLKQGGVTRVPSGVPNLSSNVHITEIFLRKLNLGEGFPRIGVGTS